MSYSENIQSSYGGRPGERLLHNGSLCWIPAHQLVFSPQMSFPEGHVNFAAAVIAALERKVQYMGFYRRNFNNMDMATL